MTLIKLLQRIREELSKDKPCSITIHSSPNDKEIGFEVKTKEKIKKD